ncbi:MAG: adenylate/guanylate cyclase domain-containing protein [Pseudobdellovibrio sp.]
MNLFKKHFSADIIGLGIILVCAIPIHYMIFIIGDAGTPYYAGLTLILIGLCVGLRLSWKYHLICIASLLAPFIFHFLYTIKGNALDSYFFLNLTFFVSMAFIGSVGKYTYEKLIEKEFLTRSQLSDELDNRAKIIEQKTSENVKLSELSRQFSPQIIESIKKGEINLSSSIHESNVAVIFIDIVDSTKKVISLNTDSVQIIVSNFMDDVMSTFLMYDITIDKFLGDGFMAFTNDPLPRKDYVERAILASDALINKIQNKILFYDHYWKGPFQIRISIASGPAAIGFYGNEKYLKTYTALGRPVILSSRLNGNAAPNCITVSKDVIDHLKSINIAFFDRMEVVDKGLQKLKGFDFEEIFAYSVKINQESTSFLGDVSCPNGHGPLVLESNPSGIYELHCRTCQFVLLEDSKKSFKLVS